MLHKAGDTISIEVGGYSDQFARNPVRIDGNITFQGKYGRDTIVAIGFGGNNHLILTPQLHQVTGTDIYASLGIDLKALDIFFEIAGSF